MIKLFDLIQIILEKPELYIGKRSIQRLYAFIGGYLYGNNEADDHCLEGFNEFVADYYKIESDNNWASIIELFSSSSQDEIDMFKELFDKFTAEKDIVYPFQIKNFEEQVFNFKENRSVGAVESAKTAKEVAEQIWRDYFKSNIAALRKPYKVFFDEESDTWLVESKWLIKSLGTACILIQKRDGKVLAVWQERDGKR